MWIFAGFYLGMAMFIVLISKYLKDKGMSATEISIIVSVTTILTMVLQPVVGALQDRLGRKAVTAAVMCVAGVTGISFAFADGYIPMLILYGVTVGLYYSVEPYLDKLATESPFTYSSVRSAGTVGFAIGAQICGVVYEHISPMGNYYLYIFFVVTTTICILISRGVSDVDGREKQKPAREVFRSPALWKYMILLALFYTNANLNVTYLPIFYTSNGVSESFFGFILLFATMMELPVIFGTRWYMRRFSNSTIITVAFSLQMIQFAIYAFVPVTAVRAATSIILRSSTTMIIMIANLQVLYSIMEPRYVMTALTLIYALPKNLITVIMQYVGGRMIDGISYEGMYIMLMCIAAAGLALTRIFRIPTDRTNTINY